jgi:peptidyl-prolyl cis-trans isomerase B (cyclophilin B)
MRTLPALILLATFLLTACAASPRQPHAVSAGDPGAVPANSPAKSVQQAVILETAVGSIALQLFPADAPQTVANFTRLVSEGFYDGLTFHRVVPGFIIQGGDPNSKDDNLFNDGQGGPGHTVPAEIKRKHEKGAVAMARMPDVVNAKRASNGSQFYIALRDLPDLDRGYTVFGKVVSGWDTIERLVALADLTDITRVNDNANPGKLALIKSARLEPLEAWLKRPIPAPTTEVDTLPH